MKTKKSSKPRKHLGFFYEGKALCDFAESEIVLQIIEVAKRVPAKIHRQNAEKYFAKLNHLHKNFEELITPEPGKGIPPEELSDSVPVWIGCIYSLTMIGKLKQDEFNGMYEFFK